MSGPDIDTDEKNAIGGIDRFVLNIALAAISVAPTLFATIAAPWRLAPLLLKQQPDGRQGMLLGAGIFFLASITVTMLISGFFATPETMASNTGLIGPTYSKSVSTAVAGGDAWRVAALIGPIYALAVVIGAASRGLRPILSPAWTLQVSLRASFYQMASSISWILLTSTIIDTISLMGNQEVSRILYLMNAVPILVLPIWQYFWFFRKTGEVSAPRAAAVAFLILVLISASIFMIDYITTAIST